MGFLTKKREIDVVSIIFISVSAVILTFFVCRLHYSSEIEKTQSTYEARIALYKRSMDNLRDINAELKKQLTEIRDEKGEVSGED